MVAIGDRKRADKIDGPSPRPVDLSLWDVLGPGAG